MRLLRKYIRASLGLTGPALAQGYTAGVWENELARAKEFDTFYKFLSLREGQKKFVSYIIKPFKEFTKIDNLYPAWLRFRSGKRERSDVIIFERNLESELLTLSEELISGTYSHGTYHNFFVRDPKYRAIHKALVRDRIVHQALFDELYPLFDQRFFFDSYSSRIDKGTQAAIARIWHFIKQESSNLNREVYVFHGDVDNFFASINHMTLLSLIAKKVKDKGYIKLCRTIINSFDLGNRTGVPLGNLTSQVFANVYLHELDYYVKQTCSVRCYIRYNDDFFIVARDKAFLDTISQNIKAFLSHNLGLSLPDNKILIRKLSAGVDMLGVVAFPFGLVPRRRVSRAALRVASEAMETGYTTTIGKQLNSYIGLLGQSKSFLLREKLRLSIGVKY